MSRRAGQLRHPWTYAPETWPGGPFDVPSGSWKHAGVALEAASSLAVVVRARRRELDLSRRELGKRAGVSAQTVSALEGGRVWPDLVTLAGLAGLAVALELDLPELLRR